MEGTKNAHRLSLPVFVITGPGNSSTREVQKGWVIEWDDDSKIFLIEFGESSPAGKLETKSSDPFVIVARRRIRTSTLDRPGQARFRFDALQHTWAALRIL